jgi:ABC-type dipeptide/oligopeptide/nickel transport system permease component
MPARQASAGTDRLILPMPWIARRIIRALLLGWAVASIVFLSTRLVADDSPQLHQQLGLDRPLAAQYFDSFARLLAGDLGRSLRDQSLVTAAIGSRLPGTLKLVGVAALLAMLIGIPGGLLAATGRHGALDRIANSLAKYALAVPVFIVATLLMLLFDPALLALPAISIAIGFAAAVFHITRAAILDVRRRDFVRTARAKGVGPGRILVHHVLRNALMPVMTALAPYLGTLLGGTVLVEYVFHYPGLFSLLIEAVNARDYPVVAGVVLVISLMLIALTLVIDLLWAVLDPRVRTA